MKRLLKWLVVLGSLGGIGFLVATKLRPKPPLVQVEQVKQGTILGSVSSVSSGVAEPARRVMLQAESLGRVTEVRVRRGDRVKAGQTLIVLDTADLNDQVRTLGASLPLLEARLTQARTRLAQLKTEQERIARLHQRGVAPIQQLESATSARDLAAGEVDAANASVAQARINLNVARSGRRKTVLTAPFDGLVLDVYVEVGDRASGSSSALTSTNLSSSTSSTGSTASLLGSSGRGTAGLVELADDREIFVLADLDELDYGRLALGQEAKVTFDALRKRTFNGRLLEIYPYVSRNADQNRTVRVKLRLPDASRGVVLPGMSANVEITTERKNGVLTVPSQCVVTRPGGRAVLRLEQGLLHETPVTVGISTWETTELTSGVKAGDRLAVPSTEVKLQDKMRVVTKDDPKASGT